MEINPTTNQFEPVQQHSQPAKQNTGGAKFGQFLGQAVNVAGQLASTVAGAQTMGMGPVAGNIIGGITGNQGTGAGLGGGDLDSALANQTNQQEQLLLLQERIQNESAQFNVLTNISKTEHETKMSAIRNVRAG
jgi:hypothetical protein